VKSVGVHPCRRADKANARFSGEEAENIVEGVAMYGLGAWALILKHFFKDSGGAVQVEFN
jgi:hypothetical protein